MFLFFCTHLVLILSWVNRQVKYLLLYTFSWILCCFTSDIFRTAGYIT